MDKIIDNVFGEMNYDYSWEKQEKLIAFGKEFDIKIIAEAYPNQNITDLQRSAYLCYQKDQINYMSKIPTTLLEYYLNNYDELASNLVIPDEINKENINAKNIVKLIRIQSLFIDRKGQFGLICDCAWDKDHGICILLSNENLSIEEQDFLF